MRAPVAFREVSQHDESTAPDDSHRPVRRRRRPGDTGNEQPAALQLVETQAELAARVAAEQEEESRRPVRRRRRGSAPLESGPLEMVETGAPGDSQGDNPPA